MSEYNYDSSKNQAIKGQFVSREVKACISDLAEHLFSFDNPNYYGTYDNWENFYATNCPNCGAVNKILDNPTPADGETEEYAEANPWQCSDCGSRFDEEPEAEMQEIYEYYIVTDWLGEKLRDRGEPVFERYLGWIWGRTCTGQGIALDSVISDICYGMEILEGQAYEWNVR